MTHMVFDISAAKRAAEGFCSDSLSRGCLFKEMPSEEDWDNKKGDAETLHTIAMLVLIEGVEGMKDEEAEDAVLSHLQKMFPEYV
ncbi:hypothetical protein A3715_10240 [Oleiphilus sp. HI0009]|nr:hypothetical protein A3715_10240 [Oleiphilus sp. HI0009]